MASRDYFDTALKKSEFLQACMRSTQADVVPEANHPSQEDDSDTITILRSEYDSLIKLVREYKALRTALISGGVPPENLDILTNPSIAKDDPQEPEWRKSPVRQAYKPNWSAEAKVFVPEAHQIDNWPSNPQSTVPTPDSRSCAGEECLATPVDHTEDDYFEETEEEEYYENNHEDRSLTLRGLSSFTTLADVLKHVKGGQILNIFKRSRSAHIAFVDPIAAEKFLIYSKRTDLYIRNKRVEVFWDDRQHYLPGHIARRIEYNGATRNLVVRFPKPEMTAESIKEDLDHIHRLEVVNITFDDAGHAFISLNSINQALIARSCMSSRLKYRGTRIEFYPDECDQPLPSIVKKTWKKMTNTRPATVGYANRYAMLDAMNAMGSAETEDDNVILLNGRRRSISVGIVSLI